MIAGQGNCRGKFALKARDHLGMRWPFCSREVGNSQVAKELIARICWPHGRVSEAALRFQRDSEAQDAFGGANILSDRLRVVRIFIGSPGGLDEERQMAHQVVDSVNRSHSEHWGIHFKLLGWENVVPGYARPQSKINDDLDRCDYFIGVLWNHWGSRPSTGPAGYTSGFEEEYYRAEKRVSDKLMRDMVVYFKTIEMPSGFLPDKSIQTVLDFKKKCIDEKKIFFKEFIDVNGFKDIVREKLEEIGWLEADVVEKEALQLNQPKPHSSEEKTVEATDGGASLLDDDARIFLDDLSQRSADWERTSPHEVARLRLIGTAISRSGNDNSYLGAHDANLIFKNFRNSVLSRQEVRALVGCGVAGFQHQNVPLWRWIARLEEAGTWDHVKLLSIIGEAADRKQAIEILKLTSRGIPSLGSDIADIEFLLSTWLSEATPSEVFDAAVAYLALNAGKDDVPFIEKAAAKSPPHLRAKIEGAIVEILSRTSVEIALKRLIDNEVDKVDAKLSRILFSSPQSLTTRTVVSCLSAKPDSIRLGAVQLLFERNEITLETAQTLLTDSSHEIRLLAAERLKELGAELDEEVAKKALMVVKPSGNGFLGLFARNERDETYYRRYLVNRLSELDFPALKAKAYAEGAFNQRELSTLYSKYPVKMITTIRENLSDGFNAEFTRGVKAWIDSGVMDSNLKGRIDKLAPSVRKELCSDALVVLCKIGKAEDLNLVRKTLGEYEIESSESLLAYLSRFGDWSDIERIKRLDNYPGASRGLLSFYEAKMPDKKAEAILAISRERIADMLALDLEDGIRRSLVKKMPRRNFVNLRDEVLLREMEHKDSDYRVIFALRCVQSLPKSRVTRLLDRYVDGGEHRFYNTAHWLDLAAALPGQMAKQIAERALSQR